MNELLLGKLRTNLERVILPSSQSKLKRELEKDCFATKILGTCYLQCLKTWYLENSLQFFLLSDSEEINKLSERLRERGVDIETERKLEQVCKYQQ